MKSPRSSPGAAT